MTPELRDGQWGKWRFLDASALVKLAVAEADAEAIRRFFNSQPNFCSNTICLGEALGVLKGKWQRKSISDDEYYKGTRQLVVDAGAKRIELDDIGLLKPTVYLAVEAMARKHSLDISDALQLKRILTGRYHRLGPNSATVLITADAQLAAAATAEKIRVWNCIAGPVPLWA